MSRIIVFLIFIGNYSLVAQNKDYTHFSSWNTLTLKFNVNEKLSVKSEFNFRRTNFLKDWEQIVLRPSIQYQILPSIKSTIGYSFIQNYSYSDHLSPLDTRENNIWQQLFINQNFKYFDISHRIRFEERYGEKVSIENHIPSITSAKYTGRLRYRFIAAIPIFQEKQISAFLYDEVFLDFERTFQPKRLNQNWIFIGLIYRKSEHLSIKSGYHHISIPSDTRTIRNHIWETTILYTL